MIINIPQTLITEMDFDNSATVKDLPAGVKDLIENARVRKCGRGFTWEIFGSTETIKALIQDMRESAEYKVWGVDPNCAAKNRRILRLCNKLDKQITRLEKLVTPR